MYRGEKGTKVRFYALAHRIVAANGKGEWVGKKRRPRTEVQTNTMHVISKY